MQADKLFNRGKDTPFDKTLYPLYVEYQKDPSCCPKCGNTVLNPDVHYSLEDSERKPRYAIACCGCGWRVEMGVALLDKPEADITTEEIIKENIKTVCTEPECLNISWSKGLCARHYLVAYRRDRKVKSVKGR